MEYIKVYLNNIEDDFQGHTRKQKYISHLIVIGGSVLKLRFHGSMPSDLALGLMNFEHELK